MKKTLLILSIITLILAGCKKFDEIEASKVEIIDEDIERGWDYIKINVEYDYPVELEAVTLYLSEKEDMSGAESYCCNVEGKTFSVEVEGLKGGVDYYYCYEYYDGYNMEKTESKVVCKEIFTVNGVFFTMIKVEDGTFSMGATSEQGSDVYSDEKPVHNVTLSDYYIGETEVTQELWTAVMGSNPSSFSNNPQRPVEQVSWNDCQEFIKKLNELTGKNFRLPTEAEWEYAARGGNKSQGYKYSGSNTIVDVAWYYDNSSSQTHDVKTKQANELGIYDMSGNVWEWCQDWYGDYSSSSQTNPTGPSSGSRRVNRGGSWGYIARGCRVSNRSNSTPDDRGSSLGLRLVL